MRISAFSIGLLALLTPLTTAWTKEGKYIQYNPVVASRLPPLF